MARNKPTKSRRGTAAEPAAEAAAQAEGISIDDGLIVTTAFLLLIATVLAFFAMNSY